MKFNAKWIILTLVVAAAVLIFVVPYLGGSDSDSDFAITSNPSAAFAEARAAGKPVFLEFYSPT